MEGDKGAALKMEKYMDTLRWGGKTEEQEEGQCNRNILE